MIRQFLIYLLQFSDFINLHLHHDDPDMVRSRIATPYCTMYDDDDDDNTLKMALVKSIYNWVGHDRLFERLDCKEKIHATSPLPHETLIINSILSNMCMIVM